MKIVTFCWWQPSCVGSPDLSRPPWDLASDILTAAAIHIKTIKAKKNKYAIINNNHNYGNDDDEKQQH